MKEKLYIATSTSNFNNILSTESISPAGFYSRRNFGYRNFKKVGPNACDGCIVLYDQIPKFSVENKDIDDYPLVIELSRYSDIVNCADLKLHSEIDTDIGKVNCFTTTQSIYLTPENTKFIFRNNTEMRLTLTNTDRALECKFVPFYREHCVVNEPQTGFSWIPFDIVEQAIDEDALLEDSKRNKLKGFLYMYLLYSQEIVSQGWAKQRLVIKKLNNFWSSVFNDGREIANLSSQQKEILKQIEEEGEQAANDVYIEGNPEAYQRFYIRIKENLIKMLEEPKIRKKIISDFHEWDNAIVKKLIPSRDLVSKNAYQSAQKEWEDFIQTKPQFVQNNKCKACGRSMRIEDVTNESGIYKKFYLEVLNNIIRDNYSLEKIQTSPYEFAKSQGKILRDLCEDGWSDSSERMYINSLIGNLSSSKPFSLKNSDSLALQSFAAFCQKADIDPSKLSNYLETKEVTDYSLCMGLWGAVAGMSNVPRTITGKYFDNSTKKDFIKDLYYFIHTQLFDVDLKETCIARPNSRTENESIRDANPSEMENNIPELERYNYETFYDGVVQDLIDEKLKIAIKDRELISENKEFYIHNPHDLLDFVMTKIDGNLSFKKKCLEQWNNLGLGCAYSLTETPNIYSKVRKCITKIGKTKHEQINTLIEKFRKEESKNDITFDKLELYLKENGENLNEKVIKIVIEKLKLICQST